MIRSWEAPLDRCAYIVRQGRDEACPADQMSRILEELRDTGETCRSIAAKLAAVLAGHCEAGLLRALDAIAAAADVSGLANAYHNPDHSRAVGVSWVNLARINNTLAASGAAAAIGAHGFALGACAAFGHDLFHDGTTNMDGPGGKVVPFRLESLAADFVAMQLAAHGVGRDDVLAARAAILATDVSAGYPVLESALAAGEAMEAPALHREEFVRLRDAGPRLLATLLRDADLLQSAGLRAGDHDRATRAILAERGLAGQLSVHATAELLFGKVLKGRFWSEAGATFQPSLDMLRALNTVRLRGPADADAPLAALAMTFAGPEGRGAATGRS